MHQGSLTLFNAQATSCRHNGPLVGQPPGECRNRRLTGDIAGNSLGWHVENDTIADRAQQFDVFRMGPDQGHGATGRAAKKKLAFGHVLAIPNLLWQ
jgi:hypothetical protein